MKRMMQSLIIVAMGVMLVVPTVFAGNMDKGAIGQGTQSIGQCMHQDKQCKKDKKDKKCKDKKDKKCKDKNKDKQCKDKQQDKQCKDKQYKDKQEDKKCKDKH